MISRRSMACVLLLFAVPGLAAAAAPARRPYKVTTKVDTDPVSVAIEATEARVSDIATELGTRLDAKVVVAPDLRNERITLDVSETALEMALISLAPRVLVDYEVQRDAPPRPLGIYLLGAGDPTPPTDSIVRGASQGLVIEGNTEDVPKAPEEDPLLVTGDRNHLSVRSRQQPLALVARAMGDVLGIPVDVKYDATELVTVNLTNGVAEETALAVSPNVRVFVRVDLNLAERTPLKIVVEKPATKK
jgi:hypothetical protein